MEEQGILYISKTLSQLLGIPVRVYRDKSLLELYSLVSLVKDPFILEDSLLDETNKDITYITTKESFYYCLLNALPHQIVVGPFSYFKISKQHISDLAFTLNISNKDKYEFESSMLSITTIPLTTVIQSLCSYNYILNNRMLTIEDITIDESVLKAYSSQSLDDEIDDNNITNSRNSTLDIELTLSKFVENGNMEGFKSWIKSAPAIRAGAMSNDYIRHQKDTFIVATTIFSRSAIHGGLSYNEALDLSDQYIKKCESCKTYEEINSLNYQMIKDYIQRVQRIKSNESPLETKIANYIYNHISEQISLDDLCKRLYVSKSNLCLKFKKETGLTITSFILEKKIDESKRLLKDTSKSISSIALYLGFSSQAHFTKVFKEFTNETPIKYRNK